MTHRPSFQIVALDHVVLNARDMGAMEQFYTQVLGCTIARRVDAIGLVQMRAGNALIDLLPASDKVPDGQQNMAHFCLRIAPFDAATLAQSLASYSVGGIEQRFGATGMGQSLYIRDPEGNIVELKEGIAG